MGLNFDFCSETSPSSKMILVLLDSAVLNRNVWQSGVAVVFGYELLYILKNRSRSWPASLFPLCIALFIQGNV